MAFMRQILSLAFVAIVLLMQDSEARPRRPPPPPCLVQALNGTTLKEGGCPNDTNCTDGPFPSTFDGESVEIFRCSRDDSSEHMDRPDHPPSFMACLLVSGDEVLINVSCTEDAPCTRGPYNVTVNETAMEATFCECEDEPNSFEDGESNEESEEYQGRGGKGGRRGGKRGKRSPRSHHKRHGPKCGPVTLAKPEDRPEMGEPKPKKPDQERQLGGRRGGKRGKRSSEHKDRPDHPPPFMACLLVSGDEVIFNVSCTEDAPCTRGPYNVTVNETAMEATFCECEDEPNSFEDGESNEESEESSEEYQGRGGKGGRRGGKRGKRSPRSHHKRHGPQCRPITLTKPEDRPEMGEPKPMTVDEGRREGRRINV